MRVIGLMSGTSLDGVDACLVELDGLPTRPHLSMTAYQANPFPTGLRDRLAKIVVGGSSATPPTVAEFAALDVDLGRAYADAVLALCATAGLAPDAIDLVGCHGQTVYHAPGDGHTWQLGRAAEIAVRTGITTISDFRSAALALGGEGAPLTPHVDALLFADVAGPIAIQNMGGIGNVTYLAGGAPVAFDTGPGNMLLDAAAARLSEGRLACDRDGALALAGTPDMALVAAWLAADPYLGRALPKSTGREDYGAAMLDRMLARAGAVAAPDLMASLTEFTAATVADQYRRFLPGDALRGVYVCGGGAQNPALMQALARALAPWPVATTSALGVAPEVREALAFAVLAYMAFQGSPFAFAGAMGGAAPHIFGQITPGRRFARGVLVPAAGTGVATERENPASRGLDTLGPADAVALMHAQDYDAVRAIDPARPAIAATVAAIAAAFRAGRRLYYVGAGTSGRLGVLDASECPPTFSSPPEQVQGLIAGGERALRHAVEGAEDDDVAGAGDIQAAGVSAGDVVVGISANGGAPYVQGALAAARAAGATTAMVTCNAVAPTAHQPDHAIVIPVGPEVLAGSTRLKAGTATKLVLNMLTTLAMAATGKVHDNLMVDVQASNAKLRVRAARLTARLTDLSEADAAALLGTADGRVKVAVVMHHQGVDAVAARAQLAANGGSLRACMRPTAGVK